MNQTALSLTDLAKRLVAAYDAFDALSWERAECPARIRDEIAALEAAISVFQAETPAEACIQIMVGLPLLDGIEDPDERERARRLVWAALHFVSRFGQVDLAAIGGNVYAPASADPWRKAEADFDAAATAIAEAGATLPVEATEAMVDAAAKACRIKSATARRLWQVMASAFASEAGSLRA